MGSYRFYHGRALTSNASLEFTKYAAWRFIRLQAQAKRSDANDRIRLAA